MNRIPIAFSFDDNLILAAGVCLSSLLKHANNNTFYDIFILHDNDANYPNSGFFEKLFNKHSNFNITYRSVGNPFPAAYEIRGITIPAYYRLLIPSIITEYEKIMYHDVDVIFRSDLSKVYIETDLHDYYLAGVLSAAPDTKESCKYRLKLGIDPNQYINSGNLIFNSEKMRKERIVELLKSKVGKPYKYQDQDILNIVCKGGIKFLPPSFSGTINMYRLASNGLKDSKFSSTDLNKLLTNGNIHYNGPKPWIEYCPNFDIWWEYYRGSVFYDPKFYFDFYISKLTSLDQLTLLQRVKLLLRFFKTGGKLK